MHAQERFVAGLTDGPWKGRADHRSLQRPPVSPAYVIPPVVVGWWVPGPARLRNWPALLVERDCTSAHPPAICNRKLQDGAAARVVLVNAVGDPGSAAEHTAIPASRRSVQADDRWSAMAWS